MIRFAHGGRTPHQFPYFALPRIMYSGIQHFSVSDISDESGLNE